MKLLAFDIDGTLIDDTFEGKTYVVYPEIIASLNALIAKGNALLFASGRSYSGLLQFSERLQSQDSVYYAAANGAVLYDHHRQILDSAYLPFSFFKKMAALYGGREGWSYLCYFADDTLGYVGSANFAPLEAGYNRMRYRDITGEKIADNTPIQKAFMTTDQDNANEIVVAPELLDQAEAYATSSFFLEFVARGVSKAHSVDVLAKKLWIPHQDIYTFGDGGNDVEMLRQFHGTATANAISQAKTAAEYVCPDAASCGVAKALREHWKLI
jgi:FMN hydrolase / 5-amino-6-(5-phospho-D-ribitylamino)uracil phosphatase